MILEVLFNAASAIVLLAVLVYLVRVYRVLAEARAGREALAALAQRFDKSVNEAARAMAELKSTAATTGENLQLRIDRGSALRDELAFLAERADGVAHRLAGPTNAPPTKAPPTKEPMTSEPRPSENGSREDEAVSARPAVLRALASVR
jgi:hypothetical protein